VVSVVDSDQLDSDRLGSPRLGPEQLESARQIAASVPDPELPMLTLADLGIMRSVAADSAGERVVVSVTPTYSGCPAMAEIRADLSRRLAAAGFSAEVRTVLSPPWTTDWITDAGRRKLAAAGIAPPGPSSPGTGPVPLTLTLPDRAVTCPACGSDDTQRTAAFAATACKDLYRCRSCSEPFEHIKEI
jgi:ring-1,2-phenylacetyl-CoA epoxidase subunit PaaD